MSRLFKAIGNMLFLINAILIFSFFNKTLNICFVKTIICSIVVLALLIVSVIECRKNDDILIDKNYNIMRILVNLIVLVIFMRDMFDSTIPLGTNSEHYALANGTFIDYNMVPITIMYLGILIYNLLNNNKIKKK